MPGVPTVVSTDQYSNKLTTTLKSLTNTKKHLHELKCLVLLAIPRPLNSELLNSSYLNLGISLVCRLTKMHDLVENGLHSNSIFILLYLILCDYQFVVQVQV